MKIWDNASLSERIAFHNVTCNNSRRARDVRLSCQLIEKLQRKIEGDESKLN
jgi:hypothetical protein